MSHQFESKSTACFFFHFEIMEGAQNRAWFQSHFSGKCWKASASSQPWEWCDSALLVFNVTSLFCAWAKFQNILALIWLDCAVIVDNEGIKIYFLPPKNMSSFHYFKMKKRAVPSDSTWWHWFHNGKTAPRNRSRTGDPWHPDRMRYSPAPLWPGWGSTGEH